MLSNLKTHEVLYMELMDADKLEAPENLPAIITLSNKIERMERECGDAITRLELETKEMIGLVGVSSPELIGVLTDVYGRSLTWFPFSRPVGPSKCPLPLTAWR